MIYRGYGYPESKNEIQKEVLEYKKELIFYRLRVSGAKKETEPKTYNPTWVFFNALARLTYWLVYIVININRLSTRMYGLHTRIVLEFKGWKRSQ